MRIKYSERHRFAGFTFKSNFHKLFSATVFLLYRPNASSSFCLVTVVDDTRGNLQCRHPLSGEQLWSLPENFDLARFRPTKLAVAHNLLDETRPSYSRFDKVLVAWSSSSESLSNYTLLALYEGGQLCGCFPSKNENVVAELPWLKIRNGIINMFDDVIMCGETVWALDRQGVLCNITRGLDVGRTIKSPIFTGSVKQRCRKGSVESNKRIKIRGWRKRLVESLDGELYLVVRTTMQSISVYQLVKDQGFYWNEVYDFQDQVLFMAKDYCFFTSAIKFHGCQLTNCIIFSESAFPIYGMNSWKFPPYHDFNCELPKSQNNMAIFRWTNDGSTVTWEGESMDFPKIIWSPPSWVLRTASHQQSESEYGSDSHSQSQSNSHPKSDTQSESEREFEDEEMQSKGSSQDEKDEEMQSVGSINDDEAEEIQYDANSQDQEEQQVQSNINRCDDPLLQEEVSPSSNGAASEEQNIEVASTSAGRGESVSTPVVNVLVHVAGKASCEYSESEIPRKDINNFVSRAYINPVIQSNGSDTLTAKFEGFDIRSDSIPTLHSIWSKYGNIVENCKMRSRKTIAALLESLASMVIILEGNSIQSLINSQVPDDLSDTLSDLRSMGFKVDWLVPYVEKVAVLQERKLEVNSLNKLSQLRAQAMEQRSKLLNEVVDIDKLVNELDEEIANLSKVIPVSVEIILDQPLGVGLS